MAEYIDKKAVLGELDRVYNLSDFPAEFYNGYQFAESIVRNFKKADVAEVRRGHWIDCEDEYSSYVRCSVCGDEYTNWEADCAQTDFCPGCGARMDGGADNGERDL